MLHWYFTTVHSQLEDDLAVQRTSVDFVSAEDIYYCSGLFFVLVFNQYLICYWPSLLFVCNV